MSHHIHTLLPLLPFEQPFKPEKVKRKRKLRLNGASSVDESDEIDDDFAVEAAMPRSRGLSSALDETVGQPPALGHFSGPAMKAMLQAQEDS